MHLQAVLLTHLGRYGEAQATFERLLTVVPDRGQTLADQAVLLEAMGEWNAADRSYRAALEADAANLTWLTAYGVFLERYERYEESLHILERALELNREDAGLRERVEMLGQYANR